MTDPTAPKPEGKPFEPLPAAPSISEQEMAPAAPVARPKSVDNAFLLWMIIAGLGVLSLILSLTVGSDDFDKLARDTLQAQNKPFTDQDVDNAATTAKVFLVVIGLIFVGLYVLFVYKMRAGRNWARITLAILGGLNVISVLLNLRSAGAVSVIFGLLQLVVILGAVYFMFRPDANQFFAAGRARR